MIFLLSFDALMCDDGKGYFWTNLDQYDNRVVTL